jgi:cytochrome c oxidase cbb3-type subunit 3
MFKNAPGKILTALALFVAGLKLSAQQATPDQGNYTLYSNGVFIVMLCIIILLLLVIIAFAEVVKAGAAQKKYKKQSSENNNSANQKIITVLLMVLAAGSLWAQDKSSGTTSAASSGTFDYWGIGAITFFCLLMVIGLELIIAFVLYRTGMNLLDVAEKKAKRKSEEQAQTIMDSKLMKSLTDAVPIEEESAILLDHNYDGIQELDNNLPPWWKYGFYLTIVVAVIYLLNFHVFHTGKLSIEEYNQEIKDGETQVAEFKKSAKNLIDESNVICMTDATSLNEGHDIFKANCVACHGEFGEGKEGLGPNFTDDYWLHGGSVQSVFRSVKYGWTDKGMKSWQQDLKPVEIQMVVSYVKSLRGSNPPNPKEKQGEFYLDAGTKPLDGGTAPATDSTKSADTLKK